MEIRNKKGLQYFRYKEILYSCGSQTTELCGILKYWDKNISLYYVITF